jgi:hypothetical protein
MLKQQGRVFPSEVDPGSSKENASKQKAGATVPIQSEWRLWSAMTLHLQGNRTPGIVRFRSQSGSIWQID